MANLIRSDIRIFQDRLDFFIKQSKTDKFKDCTQIVISPKGITVCPKTHLLVDMKLTNINDLSNYIFQSVVKLSLRGWTGGRGYGDRGCGIGGRGCGIGGRGGGKRE